MIGRLVSMLAALTGAVAWLPAAEPEVRLRVLRLPKRPAVGPWEKAFLEGFEHYIRTHPHVRLEAAAGISPPEGMGAAGELTAIAAGTAPDVFDTALGRVGYYAEQGFLRPLDDLLARELERDPDFIRKRYIPDDVWKACFFQGRCYALPWYYGGMSGFTYRKDLMRRAGIDPARAPADWDELLYFAMKCTFPEKNQYGLHVRTGLNGAYEFSFFLGAAGGQIVRQAKRCPRCGAETARDAGQPIDACSGCGADLKAVAAEWRLSYASEAGVQALQLLKRLRWCQWVRAASGEPYERPFLTDPDTGEPIYVTSPDQTEVISPVTKKTYAVPADKRRFVDPRTGEDLWRAKVYTGVVQLTDYGWQEFMDGRHVMRFGGFDFFGLIDLSRSGVDPNNVGFGPAPPRRRDMESFVYTSGCVLAMNSRVTDPAQVQAAWDHIQFMSGDYWGILTRQFVEAGYGHFVGALKLKRFGFDSLVEQMGPAALDYELKMLKLARVPPMVPGLEAVLTSELTQAMDAVLKQKDGYAVDVRGELERNQHSAQTRVIGRIDEARMARMRVAAWAIFALLVPLVLVMVIKNLRARGVGALLRTAPSAVGAGWRTHVYAWLLLAPAVLTVLTWKYVPLAWGSVMAFLDFRIMGGSRWIGLDNFIQVVNDPVFHVVLVNTFVYVGLSILLGFVAPIVLAVLLSEAGWLSLPYRVIYYLPSVVSPLVIAFLWKLLYLPDETGYLNRLLLGLGLGMQTWLHDKHLAMICVIIPGVWAGMGAGSLIYLAALKTVPEELYEAIAIDGGGLVHKIRYVMYPAIRGLIWINFIGAFIGGFQAMQNIFVMTGGGPMNATRVIGIEIWANAFLYLKFGYATAMAWTLGLMLVWFTMIQLRVLKRMEFATAGQTA